MGHKVSLPSEELLRIPSGHLFTKLPMIWGGVGLVCLVAAWFFAGDVEHFGPSYLVAFLYALSLGLGALFFTLIQFAARAGWSVVVRRTAENLMAPLPVFALLFIGVYACRGFLFSHWLHPDPTDEILARKLAYLNDGFFTVRAVVYFVIWSFLAWWFRKLSVQQDSSGDVAITRKLQNMSYPGIIAFALTITFAAIDWNMSINPHFYSTMWGVQFFAGSILSAFALIALTHLVLHRTGLIGSAVTKEHYHDLGKLVFAFTVFWAYVSYSQYFLIWYANIPEETAFFHNRSGTWAVVGAMLMAGHFGAPFLFMMPRTIKKVRWTLTIGCLWMLVFHYIDIYYAVMPNYHADGVHVTATDVLALLGVFGVYIAVAIWTMSRSALVPLKDPRLDESLAFENI
ncbi:MAG: hypothetical protein VX498_01670 [Myxococcota bacterium]|nr:hypothetical protein [Myxococcota bacterium]